eukprot:Awhi_evm1s1840
MNYLTEHADICLLGFTTGLALVLPFSLYFLTRKGCFFKFTFECHCGKVNGAILYEVCEDKWLRTQRGMTCYCEDCRKFVQILGKEDAFINEAGGVSHIVLENDSVVVAPKSRMYLKASK